MGLLNRKRVLAPLLLAAAGGPFLAMDNSWQPTWLKDGSWKNGVSLANLTGTSGSSGTAEAGEFSHRPSIPNAEATNELVKPYPLAELHDTHRGPMGDFLRFDLTPAHVFSRWERVTTVLADSNLEGLRVALVTGPKIDDLAGSLTYYFDKQHAVQRITFHGTTGDPRRLVKFVTDTYQLKPQPTLEAGLYMAHWNGKPTSALRLFHAPVVRSDQAHQRYEVQLEINRPYVPYQFKLMEPHEKQLRNGHHSNRW